MNKIWSRPYCGLTHYGHPKGVWWATVSSLADDLHLLRRWRGYCAVGGVEKFDAIDAAKRAGEMWTHHGDASPAGVQS